MEIFTGILFLGGLFAAVAAWSHLKERGGAVGGALSGAESVGRGIGWLLVRAYGIGLVLVGGFLLFAADDSGGGVKVAGAGVGAYGLYLLFGGSWVVY